MKGSLKKFAENADKPAMNLRGKLKFFVFTTSRLLMGKRLPAKRRELRMLATVAGRDGEIRAEIQNISETGLCFVLEEANLSEEFIVRLNAPLERKDHQVRCRKVWSKRFDARGMTYLRVGCAFNERSQQLRWLSSYLLDDAPIAAEPDAEAAGQ